MNLDNNKGYIGIGAFNAKRGFEGDNCLTLTCMSSSSDVSELTASNTSCTYTTMSCTATADDAMTIGSNSVASTSEEYCRYTAPHAITPTITGSSCLEQLEANSARVLRVTDFPESRGSLGPAYFSDTAGLSNQLCQSIAYAKQVITTNKSPARKSPFQPISTYPGTSTEECPSLGVKRGRTGEGQALFHDSIVQHHDAVSACTPNMHNSDNMCLSKPSTCSEMPLQRPHFQRMVTEDENFLVGPSPILPQSLKVRNGLTPLPPLPSPMPLQNVKFNMKLAIEAAIRQSSKLTGEELRSMSAARVTADTSQENSTALFRPREPTPVFEPEKDNVVPKKPRSARVQRMRLASSSSIDSSSSHLQETREKSPKKRRSRAKPVKSSKVTSDAASRKFVDSFVDIIDVMEGTTSFLTDYSDPFPIGCNDDVGGLEKHIIEDQPDDELGGLFDVTGFSSLYGEENDFNIYID